jgi:WD40 repeat protein
VVVFDSWVDDPATALAGSVATAAGIRRRESLAETLADAGAALDGEVYVILDQLEEYFVYHRATLEHGSFLAELADAVTRASVRANVLLSLREDALARLDVLKQRVPALFSNYLRLDHLDRDAGRRAIVAPPERWNEIFAGEAPVSVEPALVDDVLDQVAAGKVRGERTGLGEAEAVASAQIEAPYLQLVMERLWEVEREQGSSELRRRTLTELGGAERIVGDHLQRALRELLPSQQEVAAALFLHLVTPSGTKIAYTLDDLTRYAGAAREDVAAVVARLEAERILRSVPAAAGGTERYELFHDVLAAAALDWQTRFAAQRSEAAARRLAEARHRRALIVATASLVALVVVSTIAIFAILQRRDARNHARAAHANELAAQALLLQPVDPGKALTQALDAAQLDGTAQTEDVLRTSLIASRLRRVLTTHTPLAAIAYDPHGERVALGGQDGRVRLWTPVANRVVDTLDTGRPIASLAFTGGDHTLLVTGGGRATLWDTATGSKRVYPAVAAAVGQGGRLLLTSTTGGVAVRDAASGRVLRHIRTGGAAVELQLSPDGRTLAVVVPRADGHVTPATYDVASGRLLARLPQRGIRAIAFAPRADLLATASADGTVALWRPRTGARVHLLDDGSGSIADIAFSPDGTMLATASSDGGIRVWRVADGSRFFYFTGHLSPAVHVAFSPNGMYLVSASQDRTARVWDVGSIEAGSEAAVLAGNGGTVTDAAFAPNGRSLVTSSEDGTARLWNTQIVQQLAPIAKSSGRALAARAFGSALVDVTPSAIEVRHGRRVRRLPFHGSLFAVGPTGTVAVVHDATISVRGRRFIAPAAVVAVAFGADGKRLVAVTRNGDLLLWDVGSGKLLHRMQVERDVVRVAVAPSGDLVATGDSTGKLRLWTAKGQLQDVLSEHVQPVTGIRFDPSGRRLVTASEGTSHNAALWDARSGRLLSALVGHFGTVSAASFSPDGRWILTAGPISAAIWSADTGQLLFYLRGPTDLLTDAEWTGPSYGVVTAERDGIIRTYTCVLCRPLAGLEALAHGRLKPR